MAVDDLPRFANASCVRRVAWAERRDHIQADWFRVQPAVAAALALMGAAAVAARAELPHTHVAHDERGRLGGTVAREVRAGTRRRYRRGGSDRGSQIEGSMSSLAPVFALEQGSVYSHTT